MTSSTAADSPIFNRDDVLRSTFAVQIAILGYSDSASSLISKLNQHDWYHTATVQVRPLRYLWLLIGRWPKGELLRVKQDVQDERERAAEKVKDAEGTETGKKMKLKVDESPITDEDVSIHIEKMYHDHAKCWWYPGRSHLWMYGGIEVPQSPHDPELNLSAEETKKKIKDLLGAIEEGRMTHGRLPPGAVSMVMPAEALVSALDLRLQLQEMEMTDDATVPSVEELLVRISKGLNERSIISELVQSRRAWPVAERRLDIFAKQLEQAIKERLAKGRNQPSSASIQDLIHVINHNTLTHPKSITYFKEMNEPVPTTILRAPASSALIAETESRLGISLPNEYKEYLSLTNGNDAAFSGIIHEAPLFKCEDIRWIADDEEYFYDLTVDIPANMTSISRALGDPMDWPKIGKGLVIGIFDCFCTFLVTPEAMNRVKEKVRSILEDADISEDIKVSVKNNVNDFSGSMEAFEALDWCVVSWDAGAPGQKAWSSFTTYLSWVAERGKAVEKTEKDCWNLGYDDFFGYMFVDTKEES